MIKCEKNISQYEGEPKDLCMEYTNLTIGFVETLEKEFDLTRDEAIAVVVECANIAVMDAEDRKKYLNSYTEWNEVLN